MPQNRPAWYPYVAPIVPDCLRWAVAGKDPELRADFIVDELDDHQLGPVYEIVSSEGFQEQFFRTFPATQEYREWFGQLFDRIVANIVPLDDLEGEEGAQAEGSAPELGTTEQPPTSGGDLAPDPGAQSFEVS